MVRRQYGLRVLQMGKAGHDHVQVPLGAADKRALQFAQRFVQLIAPAAQVEAKISADLVIAAARGMQLARQRPQQLPQRRLHLAVDILLRVNGRPQWLPGNEQPLQPGNQLQRVIFAQDAGGAQHARMGHARQDILPPHARVERQRSLKLMQRGIHAGSEAPAPEGGGRIVGLWSVGHSGFSILRLGG